jgi:hypothetical protein
MIGQNRAKRIGRLVLASGKSLMLVAPSGHGKTMLAKELAGVLYVSLEHPDPPEELLGSVMWEKRTVVCDEIHACTHQDDWALFLDLFLGKLIFTTTNPEKVLEAIKTRCFLLELDPYTQKDLAEISGISGHYGKVIAKLSRGIPRRAKNLGDLYREFEGSMGDFVGVLGVQEYSGTLLFPEEVAFLQALNTGPVSKINLQRILGIANIEEVELSLLRLGLIRITGRGRELT